MVENVLDQICLGLVSKKFAIVVVEEMLRCECGEYHCGFEEEMVMDDAYKLASRLDD